jgi:hypothetical protein
VKGYRPKDIASCRRYQCANLDGQALKENGQPENGPARFFKLAP